MQTWTTKEIINEHVALPLGKISDREVEWVRLDELMLHLKQQLKAIKPAKEGYTKEQVLLLFETI